MLSALDDPVVRGIARFALPGTPFDIGPVVTERWSAVIEGVVDQRIGGHAVRAADAGALQLSVSQLDELMEHHEEQLAVDLRLERMLVECESTLGDAGLETRVLKGAAIAHRFYDDPSLRSFGDADILVRGDDLDATIDVLADHGLARRFQGPRPSFDRRFVKAVSLVGDGGLELDVHRALTPGLFGVLIDVEEVFRAAPDYVAVGGRKLPCLDPELTFVHACAHAALGDPEPRFVSLRDVAQLASEPLDPTRVRDLFARFRSEIVAHHAVVLAEQVLAVELPGDLASWARNYAGSRADRSRLASYSVRQSRYAAQAAAAFWVLPTVRERFAYASALAFPGRDYLAGRDQSYPRRLARGASLVLRWRPR